MKPLSIFIMFLLVLLMLIPLETYAVENRIKTVINQNTTEEKIVGSIREAKATLYATEKEGVLQRNLTNFKLQWMGHTHIFPRWINVTNKAFYPELYYSDINNDGKKEIIIVLTTDYGSEELIQEVHVLHIRNEGDLLEILVDNPMAIVNKDVKTKVSNSEAIITIDNKITKINVKDLGIVPEHIFENVSFGSIVKFKVINNKLMAIVGATIAPSGGYLGEIHITYTFKDNMYQIEQISFIPRWELE